MSGSAISSFAVDNMPARTAEEVSAVDNCQAIAEPLPFVRCMQKLPVETVLQGDDKLQVLHYILFFFNRRMLDTLR